MEIDYFYFIRPFLTKDIESDNGKKEFISQYKQIRDYMPSPLVAINKVIKDPSNPKTCDTIQYGEGLNVIAAMTSVIDSLYSNKHARNIDKIVFLHHLVGNDDIEKLVPHSNDSWQIALNQFGLLGIYISERHNKV